MSSESGDRLHPLWVLLATTGMRRGEALGLRWSDVDLDAGRLRVVQTVIQVRSKVTIGEPKTARVDARSPSTSARFRCSASTAGARSNSACWSVRRSTTGACLPPS